MSETHGRTPSGRVIDDEYLARAVDLAENATAENVTSVQYHRGAPSLHGGRGESPRFALRVEPDVLARAKAHAERDGRSLTDVTREFLRAYAS